MENWFMLLLLQFNGPALLAPSSVQPSFGDPYSSHGKPIQFEMTPSFGRKVSSGSTLQLDLPVYWIPVRGHRVRHGDPAIGLMHRFFPEHSDFGAVVGCALIAPISLDSRNAGQIFATSLTTELSYRHRGGEVVARGAVYGYALNETAGQSPWVRLAASPELRYWFNDQTRAALIYDVAVSHGDRDEGSLFYRDLHDIRLEASHAWGADRRLNGALDLIFDPDLKLGPGSLGIEARMSWSLGG